jgi:hypothetical protein
MTASQQPETKSPSRRALLAGALGGIGAWAVSAVGRASPVLGGVDGDVVLGSSANVETLTTKITNSTNANNVLECQSTTGISFRGHSTSGVGVFASSDADVGVFAYNSAAANPAVAAWAISNSTGVLGASGGVLPTAKAKTGVYGYANQDNTASAVYGLSPLGVGIRGHSASGYAGYFEGRVYTNAFYELGEVATPAAPLANRARLFVRDNGAGKTQLCVRFHTGAVQIIKTEL